MSWKIFITAFISLLFTAFPQNIIGCSDSEDPLDYFTSFFTRSVTETNEHRPFYYTSLLTFYDDWSNDSTIDYEADNLLKEWKNYCSKKISVKDAALFVYETNLNNIQNLLDNVSANKPLQLPESLRNNEMTKCFINNKDVETLR